MVCQDYLKSIPLPQLTNIGCYKILISFLVTSNEQCKTTSDMLSLSQKKPYFSFPLFDIIDALQAQQHF